MKDYINDINTQFIISSHVSTYEKCALPLKHSLLNNNIPIENIIIVKAGENFKSIEKDLICTNHNSFDHNAIIEILESHLNSKYWFITHDTCEAGLDFYSKIKNIPIFHPYTAMSEMAWLNMGLFSQKFIEDNRRYILSLKNCSKKRAILSERVFSKLDKHGYFGLQSQIETIKDCKIYNDGKKRNTLYFPYLDYYKFQSFDAAKVMELI